MKHQVRPFLVVCIILLGLLPLVGAHATQPSPQLELGYGPSSLLPVVQGTPIYTTGDALWFMSEYNQSVYVNLIPAGGSSAVVSMPISPRTAVGLHVFGPSDPQGQWILGVRISNGSFASVPFNFIEAPSIAQPRLTGESIQPNGSVSLAFGMALGDAYDAQGCLVGSSLPTIVAVPYPVSLGPGSVTVTASGGSVSVDSVPSGSTQGNAAFDFWIEAYYRYSYTSPQDPLLTLTGDVLAAATPSVSLSASTSANATLSLGSYVHMRSGRYDVRVFFRGAEGLSVYETTAVRNGSQPWLWLGGCTRLTTLSSGFSVSAPLGSSPGNWPRGILSVAAQGGVEGLAYTPLHLNLSAISLVAEPWGGRLPGPISVGARSSAETSACPVYDGTVYCALAALPASISLSFGYGGVTLQNSTVQVGSPDSMSSLGVLLGKLVLTGVTGGIGVSHASVTVTSQGARNRTAGAGTTGADGTATFLLLGGNYTIFYSHGNFNTTVVVRVIPGEVSTLSIAVPQAGDMALPYMLLALAGVGVALNLWVWRDAVGAGLRRRNVPEEGSGRSSGHAGE